LKFDATWPGQAIQCDSAAISLTDLRFFVSDIVLTDSSGFEHELLLEPDGHWQRQGIALIDIENAAGNCLNGTQDINQSINGLIEDADFVSLQFTLGVPFALNHSNPLLAEPPLDDSAMHWHWRSGYKFLRAGVSTSTDSFWLHLGSTGCEGTVNEISGCLFPNRTIINFPTFSHDVDRIVVDLAELFRNVNLSNGNRTNCSSSPAESSCAVPFDALGLKFGEDEGRSVQRVFQVRR
jgi:uncharacterized repeat protein (TIGR04052 family)